MKLLLVDAMNLIRRIYAAVESQAGIALEATQTRSLSIIRQVFEQLEATHVLVVFEKHEPTWRHALWPEYKAGRAPMPEHLERHLAEVEQYLQMNGLSCTRMSGWEADDVIASIADRAGRAGLDVLVLSTDKGFCQLINERIQVCNHFDRILMDEEAVRMKFGLKPNQLADFWGLSGDTTNHVPGIPGIGPKTAAHWLDQFGSLDRVLIAADQLFGRHQALVEEHWQQALLSRELVRLRTDLEAGVNLHQMRWQ